MAAMEQFVLAAFCPYEDNEIDTCVGPFPSEHDAREARKKLLDFGGHPDVEWKVVQITSFTQALQDVQEESEEDDD